ncbi:glutathione peroxidase [Mobilicoccus massiliensis]|uniref:glutathione peroxidase n=1 Tax=Mobilicoccus massiliensis TaxID=1522310 RepID=UPI00058B4887|nr:glutathione peroxidase [Mobilicoccus massiliensis]
MTALPDFSARTLDGEMRALSVYADQVVLVVNTASRCGFTPQYLGLEDLWQRRQHQGFAVLGFPCNQFARQEPGTDADIAQFCITEYDVTFPVFSKIDVNGPRAHPLWRWLRESRHGWFGNRIKWNFTKFLIGRDGQVIDRFAPVIKPSAIERHIVTALAA